MSEKDWYTLKLGERCFVKDSEYVAGIIVLRVPGGWIVHDTFVPYSGEFKGKENE